MELPAVFRLHNLGSWAGVKTSQTLVLNLFPSITLQLFTAFTNLQSTRY